MQFIDGDLLEGPRSSLVLSHIVVDEIWRPGVATPVETLGGAGVHAAVGQALQYRGAGSSALISGVGHDFPASARATMRASGIDDAGLVPLVDVTPRTIIRYSSETVRTEQPAFGRGHFERCDPQPSLIPAAHTHPEAIYLFAGTTEPAWEIVESRSPRTRVLWELDVAICDPLFHDAIRTRADLVDVVSLNEQELQGLIGGATLEHLRIAMRTLFPTVQAVALRRGERGAVLASCEGLCSATPPPDRPVVDPTGAGNAFGGALSVAWSQDQSEPGLALRAAMAAAALTVAQKGPALPITPRMRADFDRIAASLDLAAIRWEEIPA